MRPMRDTAQAQEEKPDMDETLALIVTGFHFLSEERVIQVGMGGSIPIAIPLASILLYYDTFKPPVSIEHFIRVVRAADREYLSLHAKKQERKAPSSSPPPSNSFPRLPPSA